MNTLDLFLKAWIRSDGFLSGIWEAAGLSTLEPIPEGGTRTEAEYPRIIVGVMDGKQHEFTDENDLDDEETNDDPLFIQDGRITLEIVCKKDVVKCPAPLTTVRSIAAHLQDIVLGRKTKSLPGLKGRKFSDETGAYTCTRCVQTTPSGKLPSGVGYERHRLTFDVQILRLEE